MYRRRSCVIDAFSSVGISNQQSSFKSRKAAAHFMREKASRTISSRLLSLVLLPQLSTSVPSQNPMACKRKLLSYSLPFHCSHSLHSPVVLHSDHCAEKLLPWFDGMLDADEAHFKEHGEPLFSSHMLDLSEDPKEKNIEICAKYFKRMAPLGLWLEMEIGITGGEEDGVDNTGVDNASLYTQPSDVWEVHETLSKISPNFSIAAAFGNVHGVYKPGNVKLQPELLGHHQTFAVQKLNGTETKPL